MDKKFWVSSIVVYLILSFINIASCETAAEQLDDRDIYEDDYYDENDVLSNGPDPFADITNDPPYFEQIEQRITTYPNTDVLMNCDVRNFHVNNVVMWYKDTTAIVNGQYSMNERVESLKNNSIILRNVEPEDAGDYYCDVLPQNISQHISLVVDKILTILCDGREVLNRVVVYRQGEAHRCECKTPGAADGQIKWFLNAQRADEAGVEVDENFIKLNEIDEHHMGTYQCLDDDGSQKPRHGMFEVVVHFAPKVTTHRHHINAEIGGTAELYCDYRGDPIAISRWIKNNRVLGYSEKHMIEYSKEKHFNRTTLTVRDVSVDDLGEYICQAENAIGSNELRVHLMLQPEKGQFENIQISGNKVILYWLVRSLQPLSEAVLDYKMTGAYTWSSTTVLHTHRHDSGIWKVTHEMELLPGEWQTRMKTKNTIGWSKFSMPYIFNIDDGDLNAENITLDRDRVVIAGFGGGDSSGNSTASTTFMSSFSILLIVPVIRSILNC